MSRVLGEVVGRTGEEVQVERGPLGPVQFWRGQSRYLVGELLDSWVETAPWWKQDAGPGGASAELVSTQEVWRGGGVPARAEPTLTSRPRHPSTEARGSQPGAPRVDSSQGGP